MHFFKSAFIIISLILSTSPGISAQDRQKDSLLFEELKQKAEWMYKCNELLFIQKGVHYMAVETAETYDFCIEENQDWYVIESAVQNGDWVFSQAKLKQETEFDSVSHFPDSTLKHYVNALKTAHQALQAMNDSLNFLWESHIDRQNDSLFEVIFVPAFQPSGQAIYGITLDYLVNAAANKISSFSIHFSGVKTLWIGQPRTVWLNYRTETEPEIGGVYFAWNYKDYFTKTYLDLKDRTYILEKNTAGIYSWTVRYK